MAKYKVGTYVTITSGSEKGNIGVIDEITQRGIPKEGLEARYRVCTLNNPKGILLKESIVEELCECEIPLLESAANESHLFCEMATVKGGFMSIRLSVFENEGMIPHFHFYKGIAPNKGINKSKRSGGGCICFMEPKYFSHATHDETMTSKEIKGLIEFLKAPHEIIKEISNWKYMLTLWNSENDDKKYQIPMDTPIPEYKSDMENAIGK